MIVKLPLGKIVEIGDLEEGDIVKGYYTPVGFVADDVIGRQWGVCDGEKIIPFFELEEAKKYAKVRPRFKKYLEKG